MVGSDATWPGQQDEPELGGSWALILALRLLHCVTLGQSPPSLLSSSPSTKAKSPGPLFPDQLLPAGWAGPTLLLAMSLDQGQGLLLPPIAWGRESLQVLQDGQSPGASAPCPNPQCPQLESAAGPQRSGKDFSSRLSGPLSFPRFPSSSFSCRIPRAHRGPFLRESPLHPARGSRLGPAAVPGSARARDPPRDAPKTSGTFEGGRGSGLGLPDLSPRQTVLLLGLRPGHFPWHLRPQELPVHRQERCLQAGRGDAARGLQEVKTSPALALDAYQEGLRACSKICRHQGNHVKRQPTPRQSNNARLLVPRGAGQSAESLRGRLRRALVTETQPGTPGPRTHDRCRSGLQCAEGTASHVGESTGVPRAKKPSDSVPESRVPPDVTAKHISFITSSHKSQAFKDFTV